MEGIYHLVGERFQGLQIGRRCKKPSLAFCSTAFENAVCESLDFRAVGRLKIAGRPAPQGKRY
jgi:hypothetical protein